MENVKPPFQSKTILAVLVAIVVTAAKNKGIDLPIDIEPEIQSKTYDVIQIGAIVLAGLFRLIAKDKIKM